MRRSGIDGEGVAWAIGAFVASLPIGLLVQPFRDTIGLENVVILYLLVVVAAAGIGGRAAGIVATLSAALAYDYFLTTPTTPWSSTSRPRSSPWACWSPPASESVSAAGSADGQRQLPRRTRRRSGYCTASPKQPPPEIQRSTEWPPRASTGYSTPDA
jgi:hypothetical protein